MGIFICVLKSVIVCATAAITLCVFVDIPPVYTYRPPLVFHLCTPPVLLLYSHGFIGKKAGCTDPLRPVVDAPVLVPI